MSKVDDLIASINSLKSSLDRGVQSIAPQGHGGGSSTTGGIAAGATAAAITGVIDQSIVKGATASILCIISKAAADLCAGFGSNSKSAFASMEKEWRIACGRFADVIKSHTPSGSVKSGGKSEGKSEEEKKTPSLLDKFNRYLNLGSLSLAGFIAVGLRNTVEGYKLSLAFERLGYSVVNALKPFIDLLTGFFNQASAELNFITKHGLRPKDRPNVFEEPTVNKEREYVQRLRQIDAAEAKGEQLYNGSIGPFKIKESYDEARKRAQEEALKKPGWLDFNLLPPFGRPEAMTSEREEALRKGYKGLKPDQGAEEVGGKKHNEDVTPMYHTSFMQLTSLWEQMNKAVTENPGLDVVKSWLEEKLGPAINKYMGDTGVAPSRVQGAIAP